MIHLMVLIRYCIVSFRTSVSPKLSDLVHLYYTSFVSNCQENIITKKHKNSAPVFGCGQTVDKKHSHRSKRRGVNAFFQARANICPQKMCGDRLAIFLSVPTAHSFRRASVGSRTGAVQSWQSARLASLRRRGVSLQSTHGPPKKHPTALAVGCFFVSLTQSGYFS